MKAPALTWYATAISCSGATLLAVHIDASPWAYVVMLCGSIVWCAIGFGMRDRAVMAQWGFLTALNLIGIWRWVL